MKVLPPLHLQPVIRAAFTSRLSGTALSIKFLNVEQQLNREHKTKESNPIFGPFAMESDSNFTSVLPGSRYAGVYVPSQVDFVVEAVANSGPWTILFTLLAILVAYDQGKHITQICITTKKKTETGEGVIVEAGLLTVYGLSHVYRPKGLDCRAFLEAPIHGPLSTIGQSEVRGILREMVQWPAKLRLCIPQV